ncbi:MAG: tyrosine-type recombinase/integrase [Thaumarchaeota archaeon]|nr:tyrosine-type recombinase/integrase [Nitrososphaerota archaeon]
MVVQRLERTRSTFMDKISSKDPLTQRGYEIGLNNFDNFCMEKYGKADYISELKECNDEQLYDCLQAYINWNNSLAPRTVKNYFSKVKKYLHYRGIKLDPQDIKEELDFPILIKDELYPLSLEDIQAIFKAIPYNHKVALMCELSGLMRIGETVQLRKRHMITTGQNIIVKIPATIAKFKTGRTTYFSKEASKLLRPILKRIEDEDLVFGTSENKTYAELNSEQTLRRTLRKIGLDMKYESTNRFMINTHSFRAYGITKISRHDPNFAKKLAGQKGYLLEYDRMTPEEKLELYQKLEIDLIIDDTEKLKRENEKKQKTISELEEKSNRIDELEKQGKEEKQRMDMIMKSIKQMTKQKTASIGKKIIDKKELDHEELKSFREMVSLIIHMDSKFKERFIEYVSKNRGAEFGIKDNKKFKKKYYKENYDIELDLD